MWTIYAIIPPEPLTPRVLVVDAKGRQRCDSSCLNCTASWLASIGLATATLRFASEPEAFAGEGLDLSGTPPEHLDRDVLGDLDGPGDGEAASATVDPLDRAGPANRRERRRDQAAARRDAKRRGTVH